MPKCFFQTPKYYVKEKSNTTYGMTVCDIISNNTDNARVKILMSLDDHWYI